MLDLRPTRFYRPHVRGLTCNFGRLLRNAMMLGARFTKWGLGLFIFGVFLTFGIIAHYCGGARWPTGRTLRFGTHVRGPCRLLRYKPGVWVWLRSVWRTSRQHVL